MKIIEYKLHGTNEGTMGVPVWAANGGHYYNPDDYTMITANPDTAEYYVPDTLTEYTVAELKARQVALHAKYPMQKMGANPGDDMVDMTDAEVKTQVDGWVTANS